MKQKTGHFQKNVLFSLDRPEVLVYNKRVAIADVTQWQSVRFPSRIRGFDSRHLLHKQGNPIYCVYASLKTLYIGLFIFRFILNRSYITLFVTNRVTKTLPDRFRLPKARPPFPVGAGLRLLHPRKTRWAFCLSACGGIAVKGFAGDPRSVTNGTPYRSLQPRIPFRGHLRECAVKFAASLDGSSVLAVQALFLSPFRGRTVSPCPR